MPNDRLRSAFDMFGLVAYFAIVSGELPDREILDAVTGASSGEADDDDDRREEAPEPVAEPIAA